MNIAGQNPSAVCLLPHFITAYFLSTLDELRFLNWRYSPSSLSEKLHWRQASLYDEFRHFMNSAFLLVLSAVKKQPIDRKTI